MITLFSKLFSQQGAGPVTAALLARSVAITLLFFFGFLAYLITKRLLVTGLTRLVAHTRTMWDDILLKNRVFDHFSRLAPAIVMRLMTPMALEGYPQWITLITNGLTLYMILVLVITIDAFLNALTEIYQSFDVSKKISAQPFIQVLKIITYALGCIFVVSVLLNKTPLYLLSALGALTAIFLLIFKDAILGFVAGVQLTANRMVSPGDWVEMPKYGADGDVVEVSLTTVKIQNWDMTITTIPSYALISESFKNWRGMSESGGRRIKRAIVIDINTIQFCTDEMLAKFSKIHALSEHIATKKRELATHNKKHQIVDSSLLNGRRLTNIGIFRAYALSYLRQHDQIHKGKGMTFLVRQLAPTEHGLPIEIYVFCNDTDWINYEAIQADIFDHLLSAVPDFGLRVFQNPAGSDFKRVFRGPQVVDRT